MNNSTAQIWIQIYIPTIHIRLLLPVQGLSSLSVTMELPTTLNVITSLWHTVLAQASTVSDTFPELRYYASANTPVSLMGHLSTRLALLSYVKDAKDSICRFSNLLICLTVSCLAVSTS